MTSSSRSAGANTRSVPLRVIVVAADSLARAGLSAYLQQQPRLDVVAELADAEFAGEPAAWAELYRPDAAVWEIGGPQQTMQSDRLETLVDAGVPTLVIRDERISEHADNAQFWLSGVRGILSRRASGEQLAAAIEAIACGLTVLDEPPQPLPNRPRARQTTELAVVERLTARELEVLEAIAEGMANKEIARRLAMSEHTVKFHVNAILGKLGASSRTEAVVRATRAGILLL